MRQRLGLGRQGLLRLECGFVECGAQASRPLVCLVQVDVVELDTDAQRANDADLLVAQGAQEGGIDTCQRRWAACLLLGLRQRRCAGVFDRSGWRWHLNRQLQQPVEVNFLQQRRRLRFRVRPLIVAALQRPVFACRDIDPLGALLARRGVGGHLLWRKIRLEAWIGEKQRSGCGVEFAHFQLARQQRV